ncbi:MAG: hypothetical protein ACR2RA_18990 [Geminicoccaceae bacterium]
MNSSWAGAALLLTGVLFLSWPYWCVFFSRLADWLRGNPNTGQQKSRPQQRSLFSKIGVAVVVLSACLGHAGSIASIASYFESDRHESEKGAAEDQVYKDRAAEAEPVVERPADRGSVLFNGLIAQAIEDFEKGHFNEAAKFIDRALQIGTTSLQEAAEATMIRAEIYHQQGRFGEAVSLARHATGLDSSERYTKLLARMLIDRCEPSEALARLHGMEGEDAEDMRERAQTKILLCIKGPPKG